MDGEYGTVGELLAFEVALYAHCRRCQHGARVELVPLVDRHGLNFPVEGVIRRLRCMQCRRRDVEIRLVPSGMRG